MKRGAAIPIAVALTALATSIGAADAGAVDAKATAKTVRIVLKEFKLTPSFKSVPAGKVTFVVRNAGTIEHELVVVRTNRAPGTLPVQASKAKVKDLAEVRDIQPGQTRRLTVTLTAAKYVLLCNIAGHYKAGQYAGFRAT